MYKPPYPYATRLLGRSPPTEWQHPLNVATARNARMAYRHLGAPAGEVWLVLHGGPGSGSQAGLLHPFQLGRQQVVVPDQRGAGRSRPRGQTAGNNTNQLVEDLECLRIHLCIERWNVMAGSWGTVLALAYAKTHPERVERLILRGAFGLRWSEIGGLLQPRLKKRYGTAPMCGWIPCSGNNSSNVLVRLEQLLQVGTPSVTTNHALRYWNLLEQGAALRGMWRSLLHASTAGDQQFCAAIRSDWANLQKQWRQHSARLMRPGTNHSDRRAWQKFRIQSHYLAHRGFLRPGTLNQAVRAITLQAIPIDWVHGRFDAICPINNSQKWVSQMQAMHPGLAAVHWLTAGHLGSEPGMRDCLSRLAQNPRDLP